MLRLVLSDAQDKDSGVDREPPGRASGSPLVWGMACLSKKVLLFARTTPRQRPLLANPLLRFSTSLFSLLTG